MKKRSKRDTKTGVQENSIETFSVYVRDRQCDKQSRKKGKRRVKEGEGERKKST
jgi:hypothetical protein